QWEAFSIEAGVVKGVHEWQDRLSRLEGEMRTEQKADLTTHQAVRSFVMFMQSFVTASGRIPRRNSWRGWAWHLLVLLRTYVSPSAYTSQVEDMLMQLAELDLFGDPVSLEEWVNGVTAALRDTTVEVGAFDKEGVFLGDVFAACGVQFRAVVIPGMLD